MILILKKPFNPGDADPGKLYTHLHAELMVYNSTAYVVQLSYAYGTLDEDNVFVPGKATQIQSVNIEGEDLDQLSHAMAGNGEPALAASIRLGYQYLMQKQSIEGQLNYELPLERKAAVAPPAEAPPADEPPADQPPASA